MFRKKKRRNSTFFSYRKRISECTHTLVDEIWSSLLDYPTKHLIIIDLLSALLEGYRLFDLNIPRAVLLQQTQTKYDRTLEKLRLYANDSKVKRKEKTIFFSFISFDLVR